MKSLEHLRIKAIELRNKNISLPDICKQLNLNKTTVYYWIKDIPAKVIPKLCNILASQANVKKHQLLRDAAYNEGITLYMQHKDDKIFRDFIVIYLTEGFRKTRHVVSVVNTNAKMLLASKNIIKKFTEKKIEYALALYPDNDIDEAVKFWTTSLKLSSEETIKVRQKSQPGLLKGRNNGLPHGTLTLRVSDTYFRSKLQAWMDILQIDWENLK